MIVLRQFPPAFGLPNSSPFCFKVETYLRMAGLPYEVKVGDPRKAPKGKLPVIEDDGVVISDSHHILQHLEKTKGKPLDEGLTPEQKAQMHVLRRTFEDGYYWPGVYTRWGELDGFAAINEAILQPVLPPIVRSIAPGFIRKAVMKQMHAQGIGRHAREEIFAIGRADLDAFASLLGDKPYFLGDAPRTVDATAYAFLGVTLWAPPASPLTHHLKTHTNLVSYCERMKARFFSDKASEKGSEKATAAA